MERNVAQIGKEVLKRMSQLDDLTWYRIRRKTDGIIGRAAIAPASFRLMICGCNVAGRKGDIIFVPDANNQSWVISSEEYGGNYETAE